MSIALTRATTYHASNLHFCFSLFQVLELGPHLSDLTPIAINDLVSRPRLQTLDCLGDIITQCSSMVAEILVNWQR